MMRIRSFQKDCRGINLFRLLCYLLLFPVFCHAAVDSLVTLDAVDVNLADVDRIVQGGENFKKSCLSCHSLNDFMNDDIAKTLGLTKEQMPSWPEDSWNGHPPPDLSLIALSMSPEWLYTYLRTYYEDSSRPTGYNNLVFPNTNMPNPFVDLQGKQVLIDPTYFDGGHVDHGNYWYRVIKLKHSGQMSADQFDEYVHDIVTFLTYVSDPSVHQRRSMAPWVLTYLLIFIVVTSAYFKLVGKSYFKAPKGL